MRWDKCKLIGETIKEYLLCASIVAAAIWAVYTFLITERSNIAPKPIVEVEIKVTQINSNDAKYLKSVITLYNKGNDPVWIDLSLPSLSLRSVESKNMEEQNSKPISSQFYHGYLDNSMLAYGSIKELELSEQSKMDLVYISEHKNSKSPTHIAFMETYRHKQLRKQLDAREYSEIYVFTTQANEYVYFD